MTDSGFPSWRPGFAGYGGLAFAAAIAWSGVLPDRGHERRAFAYVFAGLGNGLARTVALARSALVAVVEAIFIIFCIRLKREVRDDTAQPPGGAALGNEASMASERAESADERYMPLRPVTVE